MNMANLNAASGSLKGIRTEAGSMAQLTWETVIGIAETEDGPMMLRQAVLAQVNLIVTAYHSLCQARGEELLGDRNERLLDLLHGLPEEGRRVHDAHDIDPSNPAILIAASAYLELCNGQFGLIVNLCQEGEMAHPFETTGDDLNHLAAFIRDTKFLFDQKPE